jgi:hypothetical protein
VPALLVEWQVRLALSTLSLIVWLAIINTALAYTLCTHVLQGSGYIAGPVKLGT